MFVLDVNVTRQQASVSKSLESLCESSPTIRFLNLSCRFFVVLMVCYSILQAALSGHLDCLTYAHENGCPWTASTCAYAAGNNHIDCLAYAHENGCPWDEQTCTVAVQRGHSRCLEYAVRNNCPRNRLPSEALRKLCDGPDSSSTSSKESCVIS